jgi:hypothetical protein
MPMLPSGRHVAVDPAPLRELLSDPANAFNAHRIMAIRSVDDLFPWLSLIELVPAAKGAPANASAVAGVSASLPPGLVPRPTGRRLSDWRAEARAWTESDRTAMAQFIDERIRPHYAATLAGVHRSQEAMLASTHSLAGDLARMWQNGAHPLQDEPAIDRPLPPHGVHARLAALRYARRALAMHPGVMAAHAHAADRLWGFIATCDAKIAWPDPRPDESVAAYAVRLRLSDPFEQGNAEQAAWFDDETSIECDNLWNAFGEALRPLDRAASDVIELAWLSGAVGRSA